LYTDGLDVILNDTNNGHYAVTLNGTVSPHSTTVSDSAGAYMISGTGGIAGTGGLTKSGSGLLTISTVNTYTGNTTVNAGTLTLAAGGAIVSVNVTVAGGATLNAAGSLASTAVVTADGSVNFGVVNSTAAVTQQLASLTIDTGVTSSITHSAVGASFVSKTLHPVTLTLNGTAALDLTNNIFISSGTVATAEGLITGGQIKTTDGAGNRSGLVLGYKIAGGGNYEIRATLLGDTDLDGTVNVADLGNLATNFNSTSALWINGDFDYNGNVNVADLGDLATNFGQTLTGGAGAAAGSAASPMSLPTDAAVPEPTSLGLLGISVIALRPIRRVRRRQAVER
jgi:autotransporter-associated beta strand protein